MQILGGYVKLNYRNTRRHFKRIAATQIPGKFNSLVVLKNMTTPLPPFSCSHSPNIPELLYSLQCSVAVTTYQAGKVIFISAPTPTKLVQLPRTFEKPMGLALDKDRLAVATRDQVIVFRNAANMAANYPPHPHTYDALFLPRAAYYTGEIDIHDIFWSNDKLLAVNTRFSCLASIDDTFCFKPEWKPYFVHKITPDDHCHFNGVAIDGAEPLYATALGDTSGTESWREKKLTGGAVIDIKKNIVLTRGLPMPHSPRLYNGKLYALLSATGELVEIDRITGKPAVIKNFNGFVRGMDCIGDYLFIGLSKLRESSSAFRDLPIAKQSLFAGIVVMHLPTATITGFIKYENSVEEIYDVKILPDVRRPNILSPDKPERKMAVTTPDDDYWAITKEDQ